MSRLILSLDNQMLAEYNMTKERFTIGRLPENDLRIDNVAVSGHHCLVINILNDSFVEDLKSTNGTYVNGKLIKKHALQHGDVITIGHHQLRFVDIQSNDLEDHGLTQTMVLTPNTSTKHSPIATNTNNDVNLPHINTAIPQPAKLQVLSGAFSGRELELKKTLTTLGRPGVQVAAISRRTDGFFIIHVDSGTPDDYPLVNGQPIGQQARKLANNDVIQLAGVKIGFFEN